MGFWLARGVRRERREHEGHEGDEEAGPAVVGGWLGGQGSGWEGGGGGFWYGMESSGERR